MNINFNPVLCAVRENSNLAPEDISERLNMPLAEYLQLENGEKRITIDIAIKLGEIFNVAPEYFLIMPTQVVNYNAGENSHGGPIHIYNNHSNTEIVKELIQQLLKK